MKFAGVISSGLEQANHRTSCKKAFDLARGGTEQISRVVTCADEFSRAIWIEQEQEQRNVLAGQRLLAKKNVQAPEDLRGGRAHAEFHVQNAKNHRAQ